MSEPPTPIDFSEHGRKIRLALWRQWRPLARDKAFLIETARLKLHLSLALESEPEVIGSFFRPAFLPSLSTASAEKKKIYAVKNTTTRTILNRYVSYVLRFGVAFELTKALPHFRTRMVVDTSRKFDVRIKNAKLQPAEAVRWDGQTPIAEYFPRDVQVGPKMQKMIDDAEARLVQVADGVGGSVLRQLIEIGYGPNDMTFVVVDSGRKYLLCLIGENISLDTTWRNASKVIAEFQKNLYGRTRAGRPIKRDRLYRDLAILLRGKGSLMEKAISQARPQTEKGVYSRLSALSQLKAKLQL